jgi:hypothetical protein
MEKIISDYIISSPTPLTPLTPLNYQGLLFENLLTLKQSIDKFERESWKIRERLIMLLDKN